MNEHGFGSSIPVLRMLSEDESRRFYVEFLGYTIDWEHRFTPDDPRSPLYMQIHRGASVIHLNGHADEQTATAEVRIPVADLIGLQNELRDKSGDWPTPEAVDPRYEGKPSDMNIHDPAGNHLVFWLREGGSK